MRCSRIILLLSLALLAGCSREAELPVGGDLEWVSLQLEGGPSSRVAIDVDGGEWTDDSDEWDWGVPNTISNGDGYSWRTLTSDEWVYLLEGRSCSPKYAHATVTN